MFLFWIAPQEHESKAMCGLAQIGVLSGRLFLNDGFPSLLVPLHLVHEKLFYVFYPGRHLIATYV